MHEINRPEVVAEVSAAFARYEWALAKNDGAALNALFWDSALAVCFGTGEVAYGHAAIAAFRGGRPPPGPRSLSNTIITTYGSDFATANTEFTGANNPRSGRQSQTWLRFPEGWRIVAAHVSFPDRP
jgi:hypothetical protein